MTDAPILTDDELRKAYYELPTHWEGLRAIEQAVVARLREQGRLDGISPVEARERERKAWDASGEYLQTQTASGHAKHESWPCSWCDKARDDRYPSLLPPEPSVVTGPSGWQYRVREGKLETKHPSNPADWWPCSTILIEDAATVAALLEAKP